MPSLTSRRLLRRVLTAVMVPTLSLSAYLSSMMAILAIDGAGLLPARVRQFAAPAFGPLAWYAEDSGLPDGEGIEPFVYVAYEFGYSLR